MVTHRLRSAQAINVFPKSTKPLLMKKLVTKNNMKKSTLFPWMLVLIIFQFSKVEIFAQSNPEVNHSLKLVGTVIDGSIHLRWAPTSLGVWKESNKVGYVVERFTIRRGDQILPLAERQQGTILTSPALKPMQDENKWKILMSRNDNAAIAAQALYGESFEISDQNLGLSGAIDQQQNRFSFGLFAADQSLEVADALGLYLKDGAVKNDEYYLYKVYPSTPIAGMSIDTGYVYLGINDAFELPKIMDVETSFDDKIVYISWDKVLSSKFYSSYIVERSLNGGNFEAINALPYVGMDKEKGNANRTMMMDSLEVNDQTYAYRVIGKTIFEELSPASDPSEGKGINPKVTAPHIESVLVVDENKLGITWDFLTSNEEEISRFELHRSATDEGPYINITETKTIDKKLRYIIDENPLPVNYYKVVAIDKYERSINSYTALTQMDDEDPPVAPIGLRGKVMDDGELVVSWTKNVEADVLGYRVFIAHNKQSEQYIQITSKPIAQNFITHLMPLNTLDEEVFVKIRAVDFRHNPSEFSEIITVAKPDSVAPVAPIFKMARSGKNGINIAWENSTSVDLAETILERNDLKNDDWTALHTIAFPDDNPTKNYQDSLIDRGTKYQYRLKAIDDAGLITYSRVITATKIDNGIRLPVEGVAAQVDRKQKAVTLNWIYEPDGSDLSHFVIYRSAKEARPGKYDVIQKVTADLGEKIWGYQDAVLQMDTNYNYQVRAVYANGAQSPLSELVSINF